MPGGRLEAAVKSLKPLAPESERIKFLQEAAIMGQFLHPNVVKLHGVVTVGEPVSDALGRVFGGGGVGWLVQTLILMRGNGWLMSSCFCVLSAADDCSRDDAKGRLETLPTKLQSQVSMS